MSLQEIFDWIAKILLVPEYYSSWERNSTLALTAFSLLVGWVLSKLFAPHFRGKIVLLALSIAGFLSYWLVLFNMGGVFWYQSVVRLAFITLFVWLIFSFEDNKAG